LLGLLRPQGFPDVSRQEEEAGIGATYPAQSADVPQTVRQVAAQPVDETGAQQAPTYTYEQGQAATRAHNQMLEQERQAAQTKPKVRQTVFSDTYAHGGLVRKNMKSGGRVKGPGSGTSDSVPAMLSHGEYVMPADTVRKVGAGKLDAIKNATHNPMGGMTEMGMGGLPHMAGGGVVPATQAPVDPQAAQAASDRDAIEQSFSMQNPLVAAGADLATLPGRAFGGAYNTAARLPNAFGANLPTIADNSPFFGGNSASMTPYYDKLRAGAPAPAATPAPAAPAPAATPTAPAATPAATSAMPTITPDTSYVKGLIDKAQHLMDTEGIGGAAEAKQLFRAAGMMNQANAPIVSGQYHLQGMQAFAGRSEPHYNPLTGQYLGSYTASGPGAGTYTPYQQTYAEGQTGKDRYGNAAVYRNGKWVPAQ